MLPNEIRVALNELNHVFTGPPLRRLAVPSIVEFRLQTLCMLDREGHEHSICQLGASLLEDRSAPLLGTADWE